MKTSFVWVKTYIIWPLNIKIFLACNGILIVNSDVKISCGNLSVKDGPWNEEVLPQNLYVHRRGREWIPQWQRIQKVSHLLWHSGKLWISLKSRHGRPQTFFQGKNFSGGQEPTFCLKNNKKDTIFPKKSLKTYPPCPPLRAVFLNRWVNKLVGRGHFLLCHQNLCYCSKIIINGLQIILFCGSPITKFLNVFFWSVCPILLPIFFLFFFSTNEPELGAGIDPGMALNVDLFHLVFWTRFEPTTKTKTCIVEAA